MPAPLADRLAAYLHTVNPGNALSDEQVADEVARFLDQPSCRRDRDQVVAFVHRVRANRDVGADQLANAVAIHFGLHEEMQ